MRWWCVWFAMTGCAYVSQPKLDAKYGEIDADADGSPGRDDCDDDNPLRSPDLLEIIADGIDNDCDGSDNVDADGDQYPQVTRAVYAEMMLAQGLVDSVEEVEWPVNVFEGPADCDDDDGDVNPGRFDEPYDGIDADCDRGNDYDADGDGQMPIGTDPNVVTAFADSIGIQIDVTGLNAFGDCNDEDPSILAGAAIDEAYDGHDRNCDGSNDFDQDGDGYIPASFEDAYDAFVAAYHPDPANQPAWVATTQLGDCLDQPDAQVSLAPRLVYPGAPDNPYDGIDADCLGDSDFDADGDGFTVTGMDTAIEDYRALWDVGNPPSFVPTLRPVTVDPGDCDDTLATVAPGNLESLGDASDADCDGQNDTTPFAFGNISWDDPGTPRVLRNGNHYVVASQARLAVRYNATGNTTLYDAAPYLTFLADPAQPLPGYKPDPFEIALWANDNPAAINELSRGFDVISPNAQLIVPHSFNTPTNNIYKLALVQRTYQPLGGSYGSTQLAVATNSFVGYDADLDAVFLPHDPTSDSDEGWALVAACGGAGRTSPDSPAGDPQAIGAEAVVRLMGLEVPFATGNLVNPLDPSSVGDDTLLLGDNTGDVCWVHATRQGANLVSAEVHVCDLDGCLEFDGQILEDQTPVEGSFIAVGPSSYSGRGIVEADVHGDLLITVEDAGLVIENYADTNSMTLFGAETVLSGDASIHDGILYAIAVVAGVENKVQVAYGPWDGSEALTVIDVPVIDSSDFYTGGIDCDPDTGINCTEGRLLEPRKVAIHADADRVVLAVSAVTPDGYEPEGPDASISGANVPAPQDAVGWAFLEPLPPAASN